VGAFSGLASSAMTTTADLAVDLGVDEGDVRVLLRQLGEQTPDMPDELAAFLRELLDPRGERTASAGLYWPGADEEPRRRFGSAGRIRWRLSRPWPEGAAALRQSAVLRRPNMAHPRRKSLRRGRGQVRSGQVRAPLAFQRSSQLGIVGWYVGVPT